MVKQVPKYKYSEFKKACKKFLKLKDNSVVVSGKSDQRKLFFINSIDELLDIIVNDDLKELKFVNSTDFRLSDDDPKPVVDGYKFIYNDIRGYLAFYFRDKDKRWYIKSFHKDDDCGENQFSIEFEKLKKQGLLIDDGKGDKNE